MDVTRMHDVLLDVLVPRRRCMLCDSAENVAEGVCGKCHSKMVRIPENCCDVCGEIVFGRNVCIACALKRPPYVAARQVYVYEHQARDLVRRMKFLGEYDLPVRHFGREMARVVGAQGWAIDAIVSVPSSAKTLRTRGYNQAELLAKRVAYHLELPYVAHALTKNNDTKSQVGLTAEQRWENIRGSMQAGKGATALTGKQVLLVDDIMTTGATTQEAVRVLLRNGVKSVYVVCAARRPILEEKK